MEINHIFENQIDQTYFQNTAIKFIIFINFKYIKFIFG